MDGSTIGSDPHHASTERTGRQDGSWTVVADGAAPHHVPPRDATAGDGAASDATALRHLLDAISDAIVAREALPPRVGHAYNAVLASGGRATT